MDIKLGKKSIAFIVVFIVAEILLNFWSESKGEKAIGIFNGLSFLAVSIGAVFSFAISIWEVRKSKGKKNYVLYVLMMLVSLVISIIISYNVFGKDFIEHNPLNVPKYVPNEYLIKLSNPQEGKYYLEKGENYISLTKTDKYVWSCNGTTKTILSQEVCWGLKEGPVSKQNDNYLKIIWDSADKTYVISTDDKSLSEQELTNIITNFP